MSVYRKPTHTDRYLDFNSSHPISAKRAMVRALMDRAENVCSDPEILAEEIEHLNWVLHYNNYPQWMINKQGKSNKFGPLIHHDTGYEIKKQFYVSVPYFPGLSEAFKKIFKYMAVQVCFKGVNTLKSLPNASQRQGPYQPKERTLYTTGNAKQMAVAPHTLERHAELSGREPKNTPNCYARGHPVLGRFLCVTIIYT